MRVKIAAETRARETGTEHLRGCNKQDQDYA